MKKLLIYILLMITCMLNAQDSLNYTKFISFSPQYLFNYGIRMDFERKVGSNKWLVIAPQIYLAEKNSQSSSDEHTGRDDFNLLAGTGLSVYMKNFALKNRNSGAYLGYGLMYNYFYTEYYEDIDNDIEEVKANIHKIGFDILLGYQMMVYNVAYIDIYTGFGARKGYIENGEYSDFKFNGYPIGFNMTGNILLLGIKIGIMF